MNNEKYLKTKIKSCGGRTDTNFDDDGISKDSSHCISLSLILFGSVFKMGKNYYPEVSLEECKYIVKEQQMTRYIPNDLEISW